MKDTKIEIEMVLNGWIVTCGCQRVVFDNREELIKALRDFWNDPEGTKKRFVKTACNKNAMEPQEMRGIWHWLQENGDQQNSFRIKAPTVTVGNTRDE